MQLSKVNPIALSLHFTCNVGLNHIAQIAASALLQKT